jgi:hypothetical protein
MPKGAVRCHEAMLRVLRISVLAISILTSPLASAQSCHRAEFKGQVLGGGKFVQAIGTHLEFELQAFGDNKGWIIRLGPPGPREDWAWAVNPPLHSDSSQYMGTAYGDTVRYQLKHVHEVRFTINRVQHEAFEKLADKARGAATSGMPILKRCVLEAWVCWS